jgi:hypothetical protein
VLDAFTPKRYDVYWTPRPGTVWDSTHRTAGNTWKELDDAAGVALVLPLKEGAAFCVFGDASGYRHDGTRINAHTHQDAGWGSQCWDHWPIGWLNSQGHVVDADSLKRYPNHFSPAGMDFFAMPDEDVERGIYYSLLGVGNGGDLESIRRVARAWLAKGPAGVASPASAADLPATARQVR